MSASGNIVDRLLMSNCIVMSNVLKAGKGLADTDQVNRPNLKKAIRRIAEHGRCDVTSAFEEQLRDLARTLNEGGDVQVSGGGG